jgi:peptide/nickel transport system permease protein
MKAIAADARSLIGLTLLLAVTLMIALQPVLPIPDPYEQAISSRLRGPNSQHILGTDEYGRDILSRLLVGTRTSLMIALASACIAAVVGTLVGLWGGYLGGLSELVIMRIIDLILSFPPIVLALIVVGMLGASATNLVLVIGILYIAPFARIAYASTKATKGLEFVAAARAVGVPTFRMVSLHLLPNILSPLIVQFSLSVAAAVLLESGLSFLGIGVKPPAASLGQMIGRGRSFMTASPWYVLWPSITLCVIILCMNLVGDAIRDYSDPRTRYGRN